jgi:hypothetical protein
LDFLFGAFSVTCAGLFVLAMSATSRLPSHTRASLEGSEHRWLFQVSIFDSYFAIALFLAQTTELATLLR